MRLPLIDIAVLLILGILLAWYAYRRMVAYNVNRTFSRIFLGVALVAILMPVAILFLPVRSGSDDALRLVMWLLFSYLTAFVPLAIFALFDLVARIPALGKRSKGKRRGKKSSTKAAPHLRWLSCTGATLGCVTFAAMWWGALINRNNIDIRQVDIHIKDLPAAFEGLRVAQISDLHTGSCGTDTTFVSRLVDEILAQKPDLILFTGDIVNRSAEELRPFTPTLGRLHAPLGVYSVMGNHDYGDYRNWASSDEKADDIALLQRLQRQMGWDMLNNDHATLRRGADSLVIIGVENVGDPPFHTYGDLEAAYPTPDDPAVKILMSHNPAHWARDIKDSPDKNIALTLSGHTHAMQMSVAGISPAALRYKNWGGLYADEDDHQLYVNIGAGCVGFPARIGATPELTILTLKRR